MSTTKLTVKEYWLHTKPYRWLFFAGVFGAAAAVIIQDIVPPFIIAKAFNTLQNVYSTGGQLQFSDLSGYLIAYAAFMLAGVVLWRTQVICVWLYEVKVMRDIANRVFDFIQNLGYRFHTNHFGGALVTQTNRFINSYETLMDSLIWDITSGLATIIASIIFLLFASPAYAAVLTLVSVTYLSIIYRRARGQVPYNRREAARQSDQTAVLADAITNVNTISTFASEKLELNRFKKVTNEKYDASIKLFRYAMKTEIMSHSMTATINIIAFGAGLLAITHFHTKVSVLVLAISYTSAISGRLWQFGRVVRNINKALGDAGEMTEILELKPEVQDPENPEKINIKNGSIVFDHVRFGYADNKSRVVLPDLSFTVPGGKKVGLVGHSGGGKTTVTKLILRFMNIQGGQILIDDTNICDATQEDLRSHIAYVPQEPLLFHRSIAENIGYGKPDASQAEIIKAAKAAHAHEFIKDLPQGYDTMVGERGVKLSGGQRQRVAIARAMIKNAPILVLDEATSALDSESEKLIQDALWKLMEGRTAIVIAHRLSTIQHMDRIVVLDNGKIVEQGSHKELLGHKGVYAKLWSRQSGGFLEE
ncbi:MAG TPA: ABC transporter ATP-binding protein [Candidatus Saccharimonadales bacterium]|nr:ABC transporter ATP-binding protein [Candidatus Saccharimonadales bacterium]